MAGLEKTAATVSCCHRMVITPGCGCSNSTAMKKRSAVEETALYVEPSIVVYGLFKRFDGLFAGNDYATTFAISRCLHRGNRLGSESHSGCAYLYNALHWHGSGRRSQPSHPYSWS